MEILLEKYAERRGINPNSLRSYVNYKPSLKKLITKKPVERIAKRHGKSIVYMRKGVVITDAHAFAIEHEKQLGRSSQNSSKIKMKLWNYNL